MCACASDFASQTAAGASIVRARAQTLAADEGLCSAHCTPRPREPVRAHHGPLSSTWCDQALHNMYCLGVSRVCACKPRTEVGVGASGRACGRVEHHGYAGERQARCHARSIRGRVLRTGGASQKADQDQEAVARSREGRLESVLFQDRLASVQRARARIATNQSAPVHARPVPAPHTVERTPQQNVQNHRRAW